MQTQLEQLEQDSGIEWQKYKISDLFDIGTGGLVDANLSEPGLIPRVSVQAANNGIIDYYKEDLVNARYFDNFISVNFFGKCFYHPYRASVEMKVHTLKPKHKSLTKFTGLFISSLLNQSLGSLFSYGNQLSSSKLKSGEFYVDMPTVSRHGESKIDFDFMERFIATLNAERIATLNAERIATLNAYLLATGLKNYVLTDEERAALDGLDKVEWHVFKIEDVLIWQANISELNPLHLDPLEISKEKRFPFYGQAKTNRGIIEYRHLRDEVLNNRAGKPTILIHSNNQNTIYLDTPFYLKDGHGATSVLQSENLNKLSAQFLMGAIKKVITQKYTYNAKATKVELKSTEITLPVSSNGLPNYDFMERFISAMQKVVIKNVVDYLDARIEKTGDVCAWES